MKQWWSCFVSLVSDRHLWWCWVQVQQQQQQQQQEEQQEPAICQSMGVFVGAIFFEVPSTWRYAFSSAAWTTRSWGNSFSCWNLKGVLTFQWRWKRSCDYHMDPHVGKGPLILQNWFSQISWGNFWGWSWGRLHPTSSARLLETSRKFKGPKLPGTIPISWQASW